MNIALRSLPPGVSQTVPPPRARKLTPAAVVALATLVTIPVLSPAGPPSVEAWRSAATARTKHATSGEIVRWHRDAITLSVADSMASTTSDRIGTVAAALAAWADAHPHLPALTVNATSGDAPIGPDGVNVVRIAPDDFVMPRHALAVSLVTFSDQSGEIIDADVLVDAREHVIAMLDDGEHAEGAYDVQALLTHEIGHVLGLGEDYDDEHATMYATASPGETGKRVLTAPDRAALAPLYDAPPKTPATGCAAGRGSPGAFGIVSVALCLALGRRSRRAAAALAVALFASAPMASSAGSDEAYVSAVTTTWRGGAMVTTAHLHDGAGHAFGTITTLGGTIGDLRQLVNGALAPSVGEHVSRAQLRRSAIEERAQ